MRQMSEARTDMLSLFRYFGYSVRDEVVGGLEGWLEFGAGQVASLQRFVLSNNINDDDALGPVKCQWGLGLGASCGANILTLIMSVARARGFRVGPTFLLLGRGVR